MNPFFFHRDNSQLSIILFYVVAILLALSARLRKIFITKYGVTHNEEEIENILYIVTHINADNSQRTYRTKCAA